MGELLFGCPSVPVVRGSEVRFSIDESKLYPLFDWPLAGVSCGEITPSQPRIQWGLPTNGSRYDSYLGARLGGPRNNLTVGWRSTSASTDGRLSAVERQRVGVVAVTLGGLVQFKYW